MLSGLALCINSTSVCVRLAVLTAFAMQVMHSVRECGSDLGLLRRDRCRRQDFTLVSSEWPAGSLWAQKFTEGGFDGSVFSPGKVSFDLKFILPTAALVEETVHRLGKPSKPMRSMLIFLDKVRLPLFHF